MEKGDLGSVDGVLNLGQPGDSTDEESQPGDSTDEESPHGTSQNLEEEDTTQGTESQLNTTEFGQLDASVHGDREDPWLELDEQLYVEDDQDLLEGEEAHLGLSEQDIRDMEEKERQHLKKLYNDNRGEETSDEESYTDEGFERAAPWAPAETSGSMSLKGSASLGIDQDLVHPRHRLVPTFNLMCDAISMCNQALAPQLMADAESQMNAIIAHARGLPDLPQTHKDLGGNMVSMLPASNREAVKQCRSVINQVAGRIHVPFAMLG